ncbi:hypothetical protein VTK26DRAFT_5195 [Humicola hyalothermophila]
MPLSLFSFRGLASRLLARPSPTISAPTTSTVMSQPSRALSTTPTLAAKSKSKAPAAANKQAKKPERRSKRAPEQARDPRMINMLSHFAVLSPRRIPPPLRMGRNRYLRHWTIHRAWLLFRRREREARERTLMRQHQSMSAACEELRLTAGPGTRDEGYLYRVAMEKKGVYGLNGIPIEYARAQTETPARVAWDHDWKR